MIYFFFFFNDTATTEIYTLSLHDALPISASPRVVSANRYCWLLTASNDTRTGPMIGSRIGMRACTLKKYVSNATIVVSGDAANTIRLLMLPEPPPQLGLHGPPGSKLWL